MGVIEVAGKETHAKLDALEQAMVARGVPVECPVVDHFLPGIYAREFHAPAGAVITSKIHRTRHFFVISRGRVKVWIDGETVELAAPHHGITEPGTRRVLHVIEDLVWTTFHITDKTSVAEIEAEIIEPRGEHLLGMSSPLGQGDTLCHGQQ